MATNLSSDRDLMARDIQQLSNADAIAAFFASLGYDTDARLTQTPAAMGITAEALQKKLRRIERVAEQEDGTLQVYLVELDTVTMEATRGFARALRDRTGNYLLVLTSDYELLDFVLLERQVASATPTALSAPRVSVRFLPLTVDRRKPDLVPLRVLRRFTYTESDADAQYDKLLSAYTIARWSEPLFNNRALFADYFLRERLPSLPEWSEDPKATYLSFRQLYAGVRERLVRADEASARRHLIEPVMKVLGFALSSDKSDTSAPDYLLRTSNAPQETIACLAYIWDRNLDGKDEGRDTVRSSENPGARVVSVLETGKWQWAIVTNGKVWRLYSAAAHSRATNYYEIDLEETLAMPDPSEAFRYFWLLFRASSFKTRELTIDGELRDFSFVDLLLHESGQYAKRLGDRLKDRVFEEVFPDLARGFIAHMRKSHGAAEVISQEQLDEVFRGTLTLLYRLLFLLYAEARDLLPVREVRGYWNQSLSRLKAEIAEKAGPFQDEAPKRLVNAFSADPAKTQLYDRLMELARIVDQGDSSVNTPTYNGGLFLTEVSPVDHTPEADAARFLTANKLPDRYLALALDRLARDEDEKRGDLVPIDYKSLGVRQLGSIYEGLLEFRLRIAPEKMAIVRGKKTEEIVPYNEAVEEKRAILTEGRGRGAPERTLAKGEVYLENDRRERKATGSYYTPDNIVEYIVEHAVGPVFADHLEALRLKLREAQQAYRAAQQRQAGFQKQGMRGDDPEKVANDPRWRDAVDELFEFRVLDPAMGSGHFLVEAVDFITDKMLDILNAFPWNPVQVRLKETREAILAEMDRQGVSVDPAKLTDVNLLKRHVLKRCVYGVDLNPMAVELAKVSLWLDCFTLGAPLSFLDHHLKQGNSLIGTTIQSVETELASQAKGHYGDLFGGRLQGVLTATVTMEQLARTPDVTMEQTRKSRSLFAEFEQSLAPYKTALDIWISRYFGNRLAQEYLTLVGGDYIEEIRTSGEGLSPQYKQVIMNAAKLQQENGFFHWDLEFPEAFIDLSRRDWKPRDEQGFHVIVGNPPFIDKKHIVRHLSRLEPYWETSNHFTTARGIYDVYMLFVEKAVTLCQLRGKCCLVTPIPWLTQIEGRQLREMLLAQGTLRLLDFSDDQHFTLLTATPINNDIFDLYNQMALFTRNDRGYFAGAGIGDLQRYFINARRDSRNGRGGVALFNLLEEVVIRRTRAFIRTAYPNATIHGQAVRWPERKLRTVNYDLEATYGGIYERIVGGIEDLRLAPYRLESFKKKGVQRNEFEEGREEALAGIFKSRYLKRFESSVDAFRISIRRALEFLKTFESYILDGKVLDSASFQKAMRYLEREDAEDDVTPTSLADELDAHQEAQAFLSTLPVLDPSLYDLRRLHTAIQHDIDALTTIWHEIKDLTPEHDAKLARLKELLGTELRGKKVLLFTYYKDTARYLYRELGGEKGAAWRQSIGDPSIRRMDSGEPTRERSKLIEAFAPVANNHPELAGTPQEVDIMLSTDVLSEGQNLQDCGIVVNYDLHWNPTRMVQRAGRVDRLLSPHEEIMIYNMFPDEGLERLLGLVESLNRKITDIDRTGFLDASVLGETVHPQTFNTLRRIREEDGAVVEEQEQFSELASSEFLLQQVRSLLDAGGRRMLQDLPDGIHSGLARDGDRGVFFYFTAPGVRNDGRRHFWHYYDLRDSRILDNRYLIANLIACSPDTPRVIGDADVFQIQDKVIEHILTQSQEQHALEEAPKTLDPTQQAVSTLLRNYLNNPDFDRQELRGLIKSLAVPMRSVHVKALRGAYQQFNIAHDLQQLVASLKSLPLASGPTVSSGREPARSLARDDLHLVCFDYVWS